MVALVIAMAWSATSFPVLERAVAAPIPTAIDSGYSVTYVVRSCTSFEAVLANKARNNIQESLRDLGPDFVSPGAYPTTTALVSAQVEDNAPTQVAGCTPFPEPWRFTLGSGIRGASAGTLNLSTVTAPDAGTVIAQPGTIPELNNQGQPTGRTVASAVTVPVTAAQAQRLNTGGALWVQGGTPPAPLNNRQEEFGFASLRCANDALNGDNVEQIGWPSGVKHVFCYTFLVSPPPESATITVTKNLTAGSPGSASFLFQGDNDSSNISYEDTDGNGINDFRLTNVTATQAQSKRFIRGATRADENDLPWTFAEQPQAGWALVGGAPSCTSQNGTSSFAITGPRVAVTLGAGDNVVCTYLNEPDLPSSAALYKQSLGGVGTFAFAGTGPGIDQSTTVTTTQEGQAEPFFSSDDLEPGDYTVTETLPTDPAGTWDLTQVICQNDLGQLSDYTDEIQADGPERTVEFTVAQGRTSTCLFTDTFTPTTGSLTLGKVTINGDGFRAAVGEDPAFTLQAFPAKAGEPVDFDGTTYEESVPVPEDGTAVEVTPPLLKGSGPPDTSAGVPVGSVDEPALYALRELVPVALLQGRWEPTGVSCVDGTGNEVAPVVIDASQNAILVALTYEQPDLTCTAENTWIPNSALIVEKTATDDLALRPDPVEMELSCNQDLDLDGDGTLDGPFDDPFTVAAGDTTGGTGQLLPADTTCTLDETATGAAPQVQVTSSYRVSDITDPDNPVPLPDLDDQTEYTVPGGKVYRVDVVNRYAAYPTISVVKEATDDITLRSDDVTVALTCDDNTTENLTVSAGDDSDRIGPIVLAPATACSVSEPTGGQADNVTWQITDLTVDGIELEPTPEPPPPGEPLTLDLPSLPAGAAVTVTITNSYTPPNSPTPTPTPSTPTPIPSPSTTPTDPTSGSTGEYDDGSSNPLADTGAGAALPALIAIGGLLTAAGVSLIRRNSRRQ